MKVYIGPYKDWIGPYQLVDWLKYFGVSEDTRDKIIDRVIKVIPYKVFAFFNRDRKVKVRIDDYDTWSMDHTLAFIIAPMLKQLKDTTHGAPHVDDEDVPENLRSTNAKPKEYDYDMDEFHFARWNYVLDEMIFSFSSYNEEWEDQFYSGKSDWKFIPKNETENPEKQIFEMTEGVNHTLKVDMEGREAYQKRIDNGIRLFGKYYSSLWD